MGMFELMIMNDDLRDMIIGRRLDRRAARRRAAARHADAARVRPARHLQRHHHHRGSGARDGAGRRGLIVESTLVGAAKCDRLHSLVRLTADYGQRSDPCRHINTRRWTPAAAEVKDSDRGRQRGRSAAEDPPDGLLRDQDHREGRRQEGRQEEARPAASKKGQVFTIGGVSSQAALHLHPPVLDPAGRRPAGAAQPAHPRTPDEARRAQERPDRRGATTSSRAARSARRSAKHPKCFDRLYVNMVKAGEAGGALEVILKRLAEFKEKSQSLKRRITGAMVYPVVVMLGGRRHPDLHHDLHHPQVREDLQGLRA